MEANSTSIGNLNTEQDPTEGMMIVNNQTYDLLNHHNLTNFESNTNQDSLIENDIVTVNIKKRN